MRSTSTIIRTRATLAVMTFLRRGLWMLLILLVDWVHHQEMPSFGGVAFTISLTSRDTASSAWTCSAYLPARYTALRRTLSRRSGRCAGSPQALSPRKRYGLRSSPEMANKCPQMTIAATDAGLAHLATRTAPAQKSLAHALRVAIVNIQPVLLLVWNSVRASVSAVAPTPLEVKLTGRIIVAASIGMAIGFERRTSHRPAGIRTMSLVAIGACIFTLVSQHGFVRADQARVASSVASGVGFIGAGVITTAGKENVRSRQSATDMDGDVRGLTTASAIWITAGLGMACGTGLLFTATVGAVLTVVVLKIAQVQQSLQSKMYRLRLLLRPQLAQKAAAAAAAAAATAEEAEEEVDEKSAAAKVDDRSAGGSGKKASKRDQSRQKEDTESSKGSQEKASEGAEQLRTELAEMAEARRVLRANAVEAIKRALDPDDDVRPPLHVGRRGVDPEGSESGETATDEASEMFFDDPFFGEVLPDKSAQKAKSWTPEKDRPPPAPVRATRKRSRVLSSSEQGAATGKRGRSASRRKQSSVVHDEVSTEASSDGSHSHREKGAVNADDNSSRRSQTLVGKTGPSALAPSIAAPPAPSQAVEARDAKEKRKEGRDLKSRRKTSPRSPGSPSARKPSKAGRRDGNTSESEPTSKALSDTEARAKIADSWAEVRGSGDLST